MQASKRNSVQVRGAIERETNCGDIRYSRFESASGAFDFGHVKLASEYPHANLFPPSLGIINQWIWAKNHC